MPAPGGDWADLGCGEGAFTLALADLVGPRAYLYAVDRDAAALARLERAAPAQPSIETLHADFRRPLELPPLDGVLMANSLHFLADRSGVLELVRGYLKPGGRLIVVEYDVDRGNPWVPHPFSFATWCEMAVAAGFGRPRLIGRHPSRWLEGLYSAVSTRQ